MPAGAQRLDGKTFFGLRLYLAGRCCDNPQSARGTAQCISGPGNYMVGRRNHLLYHFLITIHLHLASFYAQNTFLKNYLGKMLIEQIIEF